MKNPGLIVEEGEVAMDEPRSWSADISYGRRLNTQRHYAGVFTVSVSDPSGSYVMVFTRADAQAIADAMAHVLADHVAQEPQP